jgi:DNA/RNA endonuclease G (NUC1)
MSKNKTEKFFIVAPSLLLGFLGGFGSALYLFYFKTEKHKHELLTGNYFGVFDKLSGSPSIERFGLPIFGQLQRYPTYTSFFDFRLRIPTFVLEHVTKADIEGSAKRPNSFYEDKTLPALYRPTNSDYRQLNQNATTQRKLSRGHMAPAADSKISQEAMKSTFYLGSVLSSGNPLLFPVLIP